VSRLGWVLACAVEALVVAGCVALLQACHAALGRPAAALTPYTAALLLSFHLIVLRPLLHGLWRRARPPGQV
jgi:hypothetical protein